MIPLSPWRERVGVRGKQNINFWNLRERDGLVMSTQNKKKAEIGMPLWLKVIIPVFLSFILAALLTIVGLLNGIQTNTNRLSTIETTLARVEERTKDIEGIKSGVDKLLGKAGIAEITPTNGGILITSNVEIEIPPNSVSESILSSVEKIPSSSLPATLPNEDYVYRDGFVWSTGGVKLDNYASVAWGLTAGAKCDDTKILYWNGAKNMWQEVPPEYCSTESSLVGFGAKVDGYYVLTQKIE